MHAFFIFFIFYILYLFIYWAGPGSAHMGWAGTPSQPSPARSLAQASDLAGLNQTSNFTRAALCEGN